VSTEKDMADLLTEQIISAVIDVHRILGPGLLESIYEEALCYELSLRSIPYNSVFSANSVVKKVR